MEEKEYFPAGPGESEEINFRSVISKYLRYWYLFTIGAIVCLGIAYGYLQYATPQYNISSKLLIKEDKSETNVAGGEAFGDLGIFNTNKNIDNEIEILQSSSLMQRVLEELSLRVSYYLEGTFRDIEIYGDHVPVKIIISRLDSAAYEKPVVVHIKENNRFLLEEEGHEPTIHQFGQQITKSYGVFTIVAGTMNVPKEGTSVIVKFHDYQKLVEVYAQKLNVTQSNKKASVLTLNLTDAVREKGKDILGKLIEVYNKEAVEDKNLIASYTIDFIDERLKYLTTELSEVEKDVEQYKRQNEVSDVNSQVRLYLAEASEYNKQLAELGVQIDVLASIEDYLTKQGDQHLLVPSSLTIQDPTLLGLINRFNEFQLERERMLRTTQADNPLVRNVTEQLFNLRINILENLRNIKNSLVITRTNLEKKTSQFGSRIRQVPGIERDLQEISRQQGVKQELYLYLLQKREESGLSLASSVSGSRAINPVKAGAYPVSPRSSVAYLLALVIGLGLPFATIYVKDLLNDRVQVLRDVEEVTAAPILGEICHNEIREAMAVTARKHSPIAELFRLIRANLQFSAAGKENKVIMITSSMSGEGKTFFSINLGASLALTGKKVAVVSFDLRKPKLMQQLNLPDETGVTNYLVTNNASVDDIVVLSPVVNGLSLIGSGPVPPNPAELMTSRRVNSLLEELRERYDYVLIDTAPVGQVSDAFTLAPYIDSCIYLVRYGYTFKAQLEIIEDIRRNKKLSHLMVVLNDARRKNGYGYGYGYGRGYGYGDDAKQKKPGRAVSHT